VPKSQVAGLDPPSSDAVPRELRRERVDRHDAVLAVPAAGGNPVGVGVDPLDRGIPVVAVLAGRAAVAVEVLHALRRAVAVVVQPVAGLGGAGVDRRPQVVAVRDGVAGEDAVAVLSIPSKPSQSWSMPSPKASEAPG
jgi:hypothetical protein